MSKDEYYGIKEVAKMLGVSDKTVRRRIQNGQLQAILKEGAYGKQYHLPKAQFEDAIETVEVLTVKKEHDIKNLALVLAKHLDERETRIVDEIHSMKAELKDEFEKKLEEQLVIQEERIREKVLEQMHSENTKLMKYIAVTREEDQKKKKWWNKIWK